MGISGISSAGMLSYVNHVASQKTNNIRKVDSANNFQDVMSDFNSNTSFVPNTMESSLLNNQNFVPQNPETYPTPINQVVDNNYNMAQNLEIPNIDINPTIGNNYDMNSNIIPNIEEPINYNNMDYRGQTLQEPIMPNTSIEPIIQNSNIVQPDQIQQSKDVMPVINTIKALAVNLENFGYKIRITDEDSMSSYKITIEVDK